MRSASESAFSHRTAKYGEEPMMMEQQPKGGRMHLLIAVLGMGSLGFMLWTIAQMLEIVPA